MRRFATLLAAVLAAAPALARTPAAEGCQALSPGVMTMKGVLAEPGRRPGEAGPLYVLQLERPLCGGQGRTVALAFPGGDPRRFVGRRMLVSGTVLPSKGAGGPVLQVGSFAPLPQVAANVS